MTSHLPDQFSNHQVRLSREIPIHFATTIFFFLDLNKSCLEGLHETEACFPIKLLHINGKLFEEKGMRCLEKKWILIWTILCRNLNLRRFVVGFGGIVFMLCLGLILFHVVVGWETGIFPLYRSLESLRKGSYMESKWIPSRVSAWAHSYTACMMYSFQRDRVPLGTLVLEFLYH